MLWKWKAQDRTKNELLHNPSQEFGTKMRLEPWILRPKVYSSLEGILEMDLSEHLAPKCARNSPLSQKAHLQHFAEIRQTFKAP